MDMVLFILWLTMGLANLIFGNRRISKFGYFCVWGSLMIELLNNVLN
jgi:hypothetical protein